MVADELTLRTRCFSQRPAALWLDLRRPQVPIRDILKRDRHAFGRGIDRDVAEELQAETGSKVFALLGTTPFLENRSGTEGVVERSRPPGAGVDGTRNEFPERVEILEYGTVWIVIMRGRVMHVRGDPHSVGYAGVLYEGEDIGDLEFAPERRT